MLIKRQKEGFTLIELLVVIAIIAILAAILFPVFSRAREQARKANCMSNMKQIAQAWLMYMQDWDGTVPARTCLPGAPGGFQMIDHYDWPVEIYPYVKNAKLYLCPSAEWVSQWVQGWDAQYDGLYSPLINYRGMACTTYTAPGWYRIPGWWWGQAPFTDAKIKSPGSKIMLGENGWPCAWDFIPDWGRHKAARNGGCVPDWHMGGVNWAFMDGHVKWLKDDWFEANDNWKAFRWEIE